MFQFVTDNPLLLRDLRNFRRHWYRNRLFWLVVALPAVVVFPLDRAIRTWATFRQMDTIFFIGTWVSCIFVSWVVPLWAALLPRSRACASLIEDCMQTPLPEAQIAKTLLLRRLFPSICIFLGFTGSLLLFLIHGDGSFDLVFERGIVVAWQWGLPWLAALLLLVVVGWLRPFRQVWWSLVALILVLTSRMQLDYPWGPLWIFPWVLLFALGFMRPLRRMWWSLAACFTIVVILRDYMMKSDYEFPNLGYPWDPWASFDAHFILIHGLFTTAFGVALGINLGLRHVRRLAPIMIICVVAALDLYLVPFLYDRTFGKGYGDFASLHWSNWHYQDFNASPLGFLWLVVKWGLVHQLGAVRISTE